MAVETPEITVGSGEHVVKFYEHDRELIEAVVPYLAAAARSGETTVVIATETHRRAFESELEACGIDLARVTASGELVSLDAAATMATFITDGKIDHDAFHNVIGGLVRKAGESGRPVRAYGEMVALLWENGDVLGAIELETLWNDLARELPFSLFCAYPAASVSGSEHADALHQVCHLHSSVLDPPARQAETVTDTEIWAEFPAEDDSPGHARRLVVSALRERGYDDTLVDDTALVLSELASNAVLHAGSPFSIQVRVEGSILRVAVEDANGVTAMARGNGLIARSGRGLGLIDVLCARWGVEDSARGKVVWAELPVRRTYGGQGR